MALYIGDNKVKVYFNGDLCELNLGLLSSMLNGAYLLSSDDNVLKDSGGSYLLAKEGE